MAKDEHVVLSGRGAVAWNAWRTGSAEAPDLSGAALRGLDFSDYDLSHADLRGADLRGAKFTGANLTGANLAEANLFKAAFDDADLTATVLSGVQFLNCAQLATARHWQSAFRDAELACGATIPQKTAAP
jgi:uncharacterized protein YjbI with pentapeptide repeats